jgi:hypothetical protein
MQSHHCAPPSSDPVQDNLYVHFTRVLPASDVRLCLIGRTSLLVVVEMLVRSHVDGFPKMDCFTAELTCNIVMETRHPAHMWSNSFDRAPGNTQILISNNRNVGLVLTSKKAVSEFFAYVLTVVALMHLNSFSMTVLQPSSPRLSSKQITYPHVNLKVQLFITSGALPFPCPQGGLTPTHRVARHI